MGSLIFQSRKCCHECSSNKTYKDREGIERWYHNLGKNKPLCQTCYERLIRYPRRAAKQGFRQYHREYNKEHDKRRRAFNFRYRAKDIRGTFRAITGYCSKCPNNIHDGSCKLTHMHHKFYIRIVPWFAREELCAHCHLKESQRLGQLKRNGGLNMCVVRK